MRKEDEKIREYKEKYGSGIYENVTQTKAGQKMFQEAINKRPTKLRPAGSVEVNNYSINSRPFKKIPKKSLSKV
jgi:hypothetical protein